MPVFSKKKVLGKKEARDVIHFIGFAVVIVTEAPPIA
jgi:hypothetical protein